MSQTHYVALADSDRVPLRGAQALGAPHPAERITVTVYVRRSPTASAASSADAVIDRALVPPTQRQKLSDQAFAAAVEADPADLAAVAEFAAETGLEVVDVDPLARSVRLAGTVAELSAAFRVSLARYGYHDAAGRQRVYRGRVGPVYIPQRLQPIVTAVLGLDNRPLGESMLVQRGGADLTAPLAVDEMAATNVAAAAVPTSPFPGTFFPPTLGTLYGFPEDTDGSGQCIAVLAFNGEPAAGHPSGGYQVDALRKYFVNVLGLPMPDIQDVVVHGPGNEPGVDGADARNHPYDSTGEIMLDLQVVGALAPGAKIVVYFTVFTEQGWADAISKIVTDTVNKPSVISCSYGNAEDIEGRGYRWTRMMINHVDEMLSDAAAHDVTVCCASGDDGSRDQGDDFLAHVDYPASSPFVLGIGGTELVASGATITSETVWNEGPGSATGGGVSTVFPVPTWQADAPVPVNVNPPNNPGRGVPDVAAVADPRTGVVIISVDGVHGYPIGGTSAAAPQWAALIARLNQALGAPVGFLNPLLYTKLSQGVLHDITSGTNGLYPSGPGWDACTGFGSPDGNALLKALKDL